MFNILLDRFRKQRVTPIICPGKSEFLAEVMGGVFPDMLQYLIRAGPIMMATLMLVLPLWIVLFLMSWCNRRCPRIFVENDLSRHVSCMQNPSIPCMIIISIIFYSLSPPFKPSTFWFSMRQYWGQVSRGLVCTWEWYSLRWPFAGVSTSWSSFYKSGVS